MRLGSRDSEPCEVFISHGQYVFHLKKNSSVKMENLPKVRPCSLMEKNTEVGVAGRRPKSRCLKDEHHYRATCRIKTPTKDS